MPLRKFWRVPVTALLVALLLQPALAGPGRDPYAHFFHPFFGELHEELEVARAEGKKAILLFFEMDDCPFCHRMKDTVLNQPQVQAYYREHFLMFPIDVEGDVEVTTFEGEPMAQKDFAFRAHRVRATPVFAFFDLDGRQIARFTGATSEIAEFLWLGEYVAEGHYKDMPFTRYKRQKQEQQATR
jgi:thioredoxin-related protein